MQSRKLSLGLAVCGVAVAVVLFIVLSGGDESDSDSTTTAGRTTTTGPPRTTTSTPAPPKIIFRNGAPVDGVREVEVAKGDPVRIDLTSDVPAEAHVHGYELTEEVEAGQPAQFDFTATLEGLFEVELHILAGTKEGSEVPVAELKVTP